ncbi:helix-turn-helix domain-containing protein [Candidatus Laterigemmans baculatus]|uniref:helix-turn-helix domain-containing protein n=1 Tax=Candidatus Laterigemmans baculatus TaxID=2770505 RepID=UPI00193B3D4A|nr:AraC family transcriptional regulator [Candidatus Laterigemmans baculatus]
MHADDPTDSTPDESEAFYDPRRRMEAFRLSPLANRKFDFEPPRTNYFTVVWVEAGSGFFWADAAQHNFGPDQLLFFVPYQYLRFRQEQPARGSVLCFHANFLCVETFHEETGCSGALFNDPYGPPIVRLDERTKEDVTAIVSWMRREQEERQLAYQDTLLSYMKILLVLAARRKAASSPSCDAAKVEFRHPVINRLRDLIEEHYRVLHAPSDYAALLHMTPKALGRCVRQQLGTTLTELIRGRILTHAKWQLLHTLKPVKEVAAEVGFQDELYFSRLFKKATGVSPKFFRQFETEIRGGSNLSMSSAHAPIPGPAEDAEDARNSTRGGE